METSCNVMFLVMTNFRWHQLQNKQAKKVQTRFTLCFENVSNWQWWAVAKMWCFYILLLGFHNPTWKPFLIWFLFGGANWAQKTCEMYRQCQSDQSCTGLRVSLNLKNYNGMHDVPSLESWLENRRESLIFWSCLFALTNSGPLFASSIESFWGNFNINFLVKAALGGRDGSYATVSL